MAGGLAWECFAGTWHSANEANQGFRSGVTVEGRRQPFRANVERWSVQAIKGGDKIAVFRPSPTLISLPHQHHVCILWPVSHPYSLHTLIVNHIVVVSSGKTRTFKPKRDVPEGTKQYQLRKYAEATLVSVPWYQDDPNISVVSRDLET